MTPKEKALRLCQQYGLITFATKYNDGYTLPLEMAKQCALISIEFALEFITGDLSERFDKTMYLLEVKEELEKL
jgi:hypothetical protein